MTGADETRAQRNTLERLSLTHGNAECLLYRSQGIEGVILLARFEDGHAVNIGEDGRARR